MRAADQTGVIIFNGTPANPVIHASTGEPVIPGVALAGLYYTTDLNASPQIDLPEDAFQLGATTPLSPSPIPDFYGLYSGGNVSLPGTVPGQDVLVQVRVWPLPYACYAEALAAGAMLPSASLVRPARLGGGILPSPALTTIGMTGFPVMFLSSLPGNHGPIAQDASHEIMEGDSLTGQLQATDVERDPLTYSLATPPTLGDLELSPDGAFIYTPFPRQSGTDQFTFKVHDGMFFSQPAVVSIRIQAAPVSAGTIHFVNSGSNLIHDGRTGEPVVWNVAVAGLYISKNLNADPLPGSPLDPFQLVLTRPIGPKGDGSDDGRFGDEIISLADIPPGEEILLQVRAWTSPASSYEEALTDTNSLVAVTDVLGPVTLGGNGIVTPVVAELPGFTQTVLHYHTGEHPPVVRETSWLVTAGRTASGYIMAFDPDGDPLTFVINPAPRYGTLDLQSDGHFTYSAVEVTSLVTDVIGLYVFDGELASEPVVLSAIVAPRIVDEGMIYFANPGELPVIDVYTGRLPEPGDMLAGIYYSTDLNATPAPGLPEDGFLLGSITQVSPTSVLLGQFNAGVVTLPGTLPGQEVLVQTRIWPTEFATFSEAMDAGSDRILVSNVIGPMTLSGGSTPVPSIAVALGGFESVVPLNQAPVAHIVATPLLELFPGASDHLVLAHDGSGAEVRLDGSLSSDPEHDPLAFAWYESGGLLPLGLTPTLTLNLDVGVHDLLLRVDDGKAVGQTTLTVEVVTPGMVLEILIEELKTLPANQTSSFLASLDAARAASERGQHQAARHQLDALLNKFDTQGKKLPPHAISRLRVGVRGLCMLRATLRALHSNKLHKAFS